MWPTDVCRHHCPDKCTNPFCTTHHAPMPVTHDLYEPRHKKVVRYECGPVKGVALVDASDLGVHEVIPMTKAELVELATHLLDTASRLP